MVEEILHLIHYLDHSEQNQHQLHLTHSQIPFQDLQAIRSLIRQLPALLRL